jgi:hypothetical protein
LRRAGGRPPSRPRGRSRAPQAMSKLTGNLRLTEQEPLPGLIEMRFSGSSTKPPRPAPTTSAARARACGHHRGSRIPKPSHVPASVGWARISLHVSTLANGLEGLGDLVPVLAGGRIATSCAAAAPHTSGQSCEVSGGGARSGCHDAAAGRPGPAGGDGARGGRADGSEGLARCPRSGLGERSGRCSADSAGSSTCRMAGAAGASTGSRRCSSPRPGRSRSVTSGGWADGWPLADVRCPRHWQGRTSR